ncbi:MAG: Uma2 family endonuclease [Myxococcota bacterium]
MSTAAPRTVISVAQGRAMEKAAPEIRVELIDGALVAMGGAKPWHAVMTGSLARRVGNALVRPCRVAAESLAVGTGVTDATFVHPDVTVLCGPSEIHPDDDTVVLNPRAVFEVLSPSTAIRDWNDKLPKYKRMASLHTVVFLDHAQRQVTAYLRTAQGWEEIVAHGGSIELRDLNLTLDVDSLYDEAVDDGGP